MPTELSASMSVGPAARPHLGSVPTTPHENKKEVPWEERYSHFLHFSQIMICSSFNHPTSSVQRDFLLAFYQAVTVTLASTAFYAGYKIAQNPQRYTFCFYSEESRKHAVAGEVKTKSCYF